MEHIRTTKRKLGVGSRGVVYEGYDEECGRFVAVKEIPFFDDSATAGNRDGGGEEEEGDCAALEESRAIVQEISLMERFEHPNLVAYYGARRSTVGVQIIMEFVNGGSLDALIRRHGSLRESVVRSYTHDILRGLAYLHDTARVCHRDIKPGNVLITADGRCKLTDFGVSKLLDDNVSMRTTVGTPWYMAPEVLNGTADEEDDHSNDDRVVDDHDDGNRSGHKDESSVKRSYTTAADIWSLGVTVFEMISGKKPFGNELKNPAAVLFAIASSDSTPPRLPDGCEASHLLRAFLNLCFLRDTRLRPKARELLTHQWFTETSAPTSRTVAGGTARAEVRVNPEWPAQAPPQLSLNMLDTADLLGGGVEFPTATVFGGRGGSNRATARAGETDPARITHDDIGGGFLSSDGYYVDLFLTSSPMGSPTKKEACGGLCETGGKFGR